MREPLPPDNDGPNVFHSFLTDDATVADVHRAFFDRDPDHELSRVLDRALGDLPRLCPDCGGICDVHELALRDRLLRRAGELSDRLKQGVEIYAQMRGFGVNDTDSLLQPVYAAWNELATLFIAAEPQDTLGDAAAEDLEEGEDGEDDDE